ncbi:MAG: hypothetical protein OEQ47_12695 [Acidimicrobiia bacterium]|nr:hypothetical protein [Acidimicrobiia bacterium]
MSGPTLVVFVGGLAAVFLFIVAVLMWQEAKSRSFDEGPVYVIEDAATFIMARLEPSITARLKRSDVIRILEWEIYYLQGLAQKRRSNPVETVAGGIDASVEFIAREVAEKNKVTYDSEDVVAVLAAEADYLASIGAVGAPVVEQRDDPS